MESSSPDRLGEPVANATRVPSAEMEGERDSPLAGAPDGPVALLTRVVVSATRSRTKTPRTAASSVNRLVASERKAT